MLTHALDLEHLSIAAYTAGIPLLPALAQKAGKEFLLQEFAHASAVATLVKQAGGKPGAPPPSYDLGNPRRPADVLALLHRIERTTIAAYLDAITRLPPGTVRTRLATILTNEAQHLAVVRLLLGLAPVPAALADGTE
jgi:hypothetical protein